MDKLNKVCSEGKFIIIDYLNLPKDVKESIQGMHNFGNDRYLEYYSELEDWTLDEIIEYRHNQVECGNIEFMDLDKFVKEYGLVLEYYMIMNSLLPSLDGIDKILIEICW